MRWGQKSRFFYLAQELGLLGGARDIYGGQSRRPLQLRSNAIRRKHFQDGGGKSKRVTAARLFTRLILQVLIGVIFLGNGLSAANKNSRYKRKNKTVYGPFTASRR